jgi:heme/copper-type cytochrome/quinol oxidase subunit 2
MDSPFNPHYAIPQGILFIIGFIVVILIIWPIAAIIQGAKEKAETGNASGSLIAASAWIAFMAIITTVVSFMQLYQYWNRAPTSQRDSNFTGRSSSPPNRVERLSPRPPRVVVERLPKKSALKKPSTVIRSNPLFSSSRQQPLTRRVIGRPHRE